MIFTLVTAVQEKLNEIVDQIKSRREEENLRIEREAEEAEKVCFLCSRVKLITWISKTVLQYCYCVN